MNTCILPFFRGGSGNKVCEEKEVILFSSLSGFTSTALGCITSTIWEALVEEI